jgi:hypothetical protein
MNTTTVTNNICSELYLLGIQTFSNTMDEKEANDLVSLMMEKEIRLRIPIEEDLLS